MHVTLVSIDNEHSWTFLSPTDNVTSDILKRTPIPSLPLPSSKSSRHAHTAFADASSTTCYLAPPSHTMIYPSYTVDRSAKSGPFPFAPGASESPYIPDLDDEESPNAPTPSPLAESLRAPAWGTLICAPPSTDYTALSTTQLFLLHTAHSMRSTYSASTRTGDSPPSRSEEHAVLMGDIVRSFHELAVLSRARWKLHADPVLPFHLAALEVMRAALSGGAADP